MINTVNGYIEELDKLFNKNYIATLKYGWVKCVIPKADYTEK